MSSHPKKFVHTLLDKGAFWSSLCRGTHTYASHHSSANVKFLTVEEEKKEKGSRKEKKEKEARKSGAGGGRGDDRGRETFFC